MRSDTEALPPTRHQERVAWIALLLCLCFLVADRWLSLDQFGFRYVDDDQAIMWNGAEEMAHGRFHEPCFYGQRYNTMLEGLVAVPLLWSGARHAIALPLMTSVLALLPFVLLAAILARKQEPVLAAFVLVLPVTLSPEFGMITSMPRGFVSGIFLASLAALPLFSDRSVVFLLSPFCAILALFANPNAALVLAPAGLLILLEKHSDRRLYLLGVAGALPAAALYYLGHRFYDVHPFHQVHRSWELTFNAGDIRWGDIASYLDDVTPLLWGNGPFALVVIGLLAVALGKARQWKPMIALLAGVVLLVASFGLNKVHDGSLSVFYPWSRMFLGIPFLLALFVARWKAPLPRRIILLMPLLAAGFFTFKCFTRTSSIEKQMAVKEKNMHVEEVSELERKCRMINTVAHDHQASLLVIGWEPDKHLTNYGCPCLLPEFPQTVEPELDRRTWKLQTLAPRVMPNVLFADYPQETFEGRSDQHPRFERVSDEPLLYLLQGNAQRTDVMLDIRGFGMRPH